MTTQAPPTYADGLREALDVMRRHLTGTGAPLYAVEADLEQRIAAHETTAAQRGLEGMSRAAHRWTLAEAAQVDAAIRTVAARGEELTTADVWAELGEGFPVTKGIAAKMLAAQRAGVIVNTGRTRFNDHPRHDHAHGQRLALWRPVRQETQ